MQAHKIDRNIFTPAPKEAKLPPDILLRVLKSHYGMVDSGTAWFETYHPVYTEKMKMKPAYFDPCLLYKSVDNTKIALVGFITDVTLNTGTTEFQSMETETIKVFDTKLKLTPLLTVRCRGTDTLWIFNHLLTDLYSYQMESYRLSQSSVESVVFLSKYHIQADLMLLIARQSWHKSQDLL